MCNAVSVQCVKELSNDSLLNTKLSFVSHVANCVELFLIHYQGAMQMIPFLFTVSSRRRSFIYTEGRKQSVARSCPSFETVLFPVQNIDLPVATSSLAMPCCCHTNCSLSILNGNHTHSPLTNGMM